MTGTEQHKWDERYGTPPSGSTPPCQVLQEFSHLLPRQGVALDLAAGRGGNAVLLSKSGLETVAWDISAVAMEQLRDTTHRQQLSITAVQRDVVAQPPAAESFDVIVVSRFLHRPLCKQLVAALRPEGLLYYQTFTKESVSSASGPSNPDYLLGPNELLSLFSELEVIAYREERLLGNLQQGLRNEAYLVAQRTSSRDF